MRLLLLILLTSVSLVCPCTFKIHDTDTVQKTTMDDTDTDYTSTSLDEFLDNFSNVERYVKGEYSTEYEDIVCEVWADIKDSVFDTEDTVYNDRAMNREDGYVCEERMGLDDYRNVVCRDGSYDSDWDDDMVMEQYYEMKKEA